MTTKQVALIGRMRGGTTVLRQFIGSPPMCCDIGETFHEQTFKGNNFWGFLNQLTKSDATYIHPAAWPDAWTRFLELQGTQFQASVLVFDAKIDYFPFILRQDCLYDWFFFDSPNVQYVLLLRRNVLAQVLSRSRAVHTNIWSAINPNSGEGQREKFLKLSANYLPLQARALGDGIVVDVDEIYAAVDYISRSNDAVIARLAGRIHLHLWFEDLFDKTGDFSEAVAHQVAEVCKIDFKLYDRRPVVKKQNEQSVFFGIANREILTERFAGSPYEWMLELRP